MENLANPGRRRFFSGKIRQEQVLRLPWVINETVFLAQCTQCQSCVSACETQIIVRDAQGYPKIDFSKGECTFCYKCIDTCSEPLFTKQKKQVPLTEVHDYQYPWPIEFNISEKCLAKNNVYCQSCRDECEPNAIKFSFIASEKVNPIPQPTVNLTDCNQCGACLSTCPQQAISFKFRSQNQMQINSSNAVGHKQEVTHVK